MVRVCSATKRERRRRSESRAVAKLKIRKDSRLEADLRDLLVKSRQVFKISNEGRLSAEGFAFSDYLVLISTCLDHSAVDSEGAFQSAITGALKNLLLTGDTSSEEFIRSCNQHLRKKPPNLVRYGMWADLHLEADQALRAQLVMGDVRLYFGNQPPAYITKTPHEELDFLSVHERLPSGCAIWGYVNAPTDGEAGRAISEAFERLQALVNFQAHYLKGIDMFRSGLRHTSAFQVGPNFYLLNRDEKKWSRVIWMVEHFNPTIWRKQRVKLSAVNRALKAVKSHDARIRKSPLSARLSDTLTHLNTSWVTPLRSERALSLWMALEALYSERSTNTNQSAIIKRATKDLTGEDKFLMEKRLRFMVEIRNSTVHAHKKFTNLDSQEHILQACSKFVMNCYLDVLLLNNNIISCENDYFIYLDSSANPDVLEKRMKILHYKAKRLRS